MNDLINNSKTLDECFTDLILKRGWWKNSDFDRKTAHFHKKQFLLGKLPDEIKRVYLENAGYKKVQQELWKISL